MSRPRLLFAGAEEPTGPWSDAFDREAPGIEFIVDAPDLDLTGIRYCLAWKPKAEIWLALAELRAIFSLGAGVDRLLCDRHVPANVPIIRMVEPGLTNGMVEYVVWQCLFHHRRIWELQEAQLAGEWRPHVYPTAKERVVGVMGLGEIGLACARKLAEFGFTVKGWSRTAKSEPGIICFSGDSQLPAFLENVQILICLLPLTKETVGILNARTLASLSEGACLINAARGKHLVEEDLLAAMQSGRIAAATLDVFQTEPLPPEHPFWTTRRLFVTPHNAGSTDPLGAARYIAAEITRMEQGLPPLHAIDRSLGY